MTQQKTYVHNYPVLYEEDAIEGVRYLRDDLDSEEASVFFYYARYRGPAKFEDDADRQYTLKYQDNVYILTRR
jgi:hypothetical protein